MAVLVVLGLPVSTFTLSLDLPDYLSGNMITKNIVVRRRFWSPADLEIVRRTTFLAGLQYSLTYQ